jgi:RHS repeat-associated protein
VGFKDASGVVTKTIEYTYDVNDRRIGKTIDGVVAERYVYDGSDIALVFDGAGSQTHRYLYGTGVDTVLADERGGAVVWALADNQGTIRDIVDGNGVILNHVTYDSFGRVVSQTSSSVEFRYGYTGREQDSETGFDYYRARYYDSANGRFISEDPLGFGARDTNLTRYVGNSPTNWRDPSGRQCSDNPWGWVGDAVGEYLIKPLVLTGLAGIKLLGDNATNGLNNVRDYISRPPEGSINPSPPPFPNPNNDRLRLGNNQVEGYPSHPIDIPPLGGFDPTPVPTTTHTGYPSSPDDLFKPYFEITPSLPPQRPNGPISVDQALDLADKFLDPGIGGKFVEQGTGVQFIQDSYILHSACSFAK